MTSSTLEPAFGLTDERTYHLLHEIYPWDYLLRADSNQRTDPTALRLRDWYEQADKDIGQYFGEVQTTRARILRQQMNNE
jgi:hypothetical protein